MLAVVLGVAFIAASIGACELFTIIKRHFQSRPFKPKKRLDVTIRPAKTNKQFWN